MTDDPAWLKKSFSPKAPERPDRNPGATFTPKAPAETSENKPVAPLPPADEDA